jgi:septation ring formation regulator EzrA
MIGSIQERDWKYLRSIQDELLNELCSRILTKAGEIAAGEKGSPRQRYQTLCRHLQKSDDIIADCFDDWRRSTISDRIISLRHHQLLTEEHVKHMSEKAQDWLRMIEARISGLDDKYEGP